MKSKLILLLTAFFLCSAFKADKPVITIFGAQEGDTIILSNQTANGFTVQILNGGVGVARSINYVSDGY